LTVGDGISENDGSISLDGGSIIINGYLNNTNVLGGAGNLTVNLTGSLLNSGSMEMDSGSLYVYGTVYNMNTLSLLGGTATVDGGELIGVASSEIDIPVTVINDGYTDYVP